MADAPINPNLTGPILTQRIPCWPYADPKGRHVVHIDAWDWAGNRTARDWVVGGGALPRVRVRRPRVARPQTEEECLR